MMSYKTLFLLKAIFFPLLMAFCACTFGFNNTQQKAFQLQRIPDTSGALTDPSKIDWENVERLSAIDANLVAISKSGDSILVSRQDYIKYARENNKISKDALFENTEIAPQYPGGDRAWLNNLIRNIRYPQPALNNQVTGNVIIQFIVHEDGKISDIKPLTHFGSGLEQEAIRLVKQSGRWYPAIQNFHLVKAYSKLSVLFKQ